MNSWSWLRGARFDRIARMSESLYSRWRFIRNVSYLTWMCESAVSDSWPYMDLNWFEWILIGFHRFSWIFMDYHWFSWILMDLDGFGWIWMDMDWYGLIWIWIYGYGYMDIWIYGCLDIWIYGYMDVYIRWLGLTGGRGPPPSPPQTPSHPHIYEWPSPSNSLSI